MDILDLLASDEIINYDYDNDRILTTPECENVYIPLDIIKNKALKTNEKVYLSMYYQYGNNEYYADKNMLEVCSKQVLLRIKRKLKKLNLIIAPLSALDAKNIVLKNKNTGYTCEWCQEKTNAIQEHHYPIPRCKGGKEIVKICPNCHFEYHQIFKGE